MATTPKVLTYDEWLSLPQVSGVREETVNGEIRLMPPVKWNHEEILAELSWQLMSQLDRTTVRVAASRFGLVIHRDPVTCRVPDLAVFIRANIVEQDGYIHSAPELVIEVLSPGNTQTERDEKRRDYESIGVPEFWVVSPASRTIEVLELSDGRLHTIAIRDDGQIAPKLFPDAVVNIESIWP